MEIVDAELMEDKEYASLGKTPAHRVKALLDRLDSVRRSRQGGYEVSDTARGTSHKFVGRVQQIFKNRPNPLEWRSFYTNDLPILLSTCKEVQDASIKHNLNKSQIKALTKLKKVSENEFKRITCILHELETSTNHLEEKAVLPFLLNTDLKHGFTVARVRRCRWFKKKSREMILVKPPRRNSYVSQATYRKLKIWKVERIYELQL